MHNHIFKELQKGQKFENSELIRAIRHSIADEYEAIGLYEIISENTDNKKAKKLFDEIVDDEKEHVGNLLALLKILSPEESELYAEGEKETGEIVGE